MLSCKAAPEAPEARTQEEVAEFVLQLWEAGEDCRGKLGAVLRWTEEVSK